MTRYLFAALLAVVALVAEARPAAAQFLQSNSSSFSNSYSSNWGRSTGFGPNGYFNNGYSNQAGRSSFSNQSMGYSPYGGFSQGRTFNSGFNQSNGFSQGYSPYGGAYNQSFGNFNQFNNGRQFQNVWGW